MYKLFKQFWKSRQLKRWQHINASRKHYYDKQKSQNNIHSSKFLAFYLKIKACHHTCRDQCYRIASPCTHSCTSSKVSNKCSFLRKFQLHKPNNRVASCKYLTFLLVLTNQSGWWIWQSIALRGCKDVLEKLEFFWDKDSFSHKHLNSLSGWCDSYNGVCLLWSICKHIQCSA